MATVAAIDNVEIVSGAIEQNAPKPTELLGLLGAQLSYEEIQDVVSELLEAGTIEFGSDRRLRLVHVHR
jgi:hypothetical protein